jgi:hypothetical protein
MLCNLFLDPGVILLEIYSDNAVIVTFELFYQYCWPYVWFEHPEHMYGSFGSLLSEPEYDTGATYLLYIIKMQVEVPRGASTFALKR